MNLNRTVIMALLVSTAAWSLPRAPQITASGYLVDTAGNPVTAETTLNARLYFNAATPVGQEFHFEKFIIKPGAGGFFRVQLGTSSVIDITKFKDVMPGDAVYLGLQVEGEGEMSPRVRFSSAPWALSVDWEGISSVPTLFPAAPHTHPAADLKGLPAHTHGAADLTALPGHMHPWADLTGVPAGLADGDNTVQSALAPLMWNATSQSLAMSKATGTTDGWISAADWLSFAAKIDATDPRLTDARQPVAGNNFYIQNQIATAQNASFSIAGNGLFGNGTINIGGNGQIVGSNSAGNLHLDSDKTKADGRLYLNWINGKGVVVGNGAGGPAAVFDTAGNLNVVGTMTAGAISANNISTPSQGRLYGFNNGFGNFHIDSNSAGTDGRIYFNWFDGRGVVFGNGAGAPVGSMSSAGQLNATGGVTSASVIHGGGSAGSAFLIGNDAELADVNQANTAVLRGLQDANQGTLQLGNASTVRVATTGNSYINAGGNFGINTPTPTHALTVGSSGGGNTLVRIGTNGFPMYFITPQGGIGFNAYFAAGWKYGETASPGAHASFVAWANDFTPRLVLGGSSTPGTFGAAATMQQTLAVFSNNTIGVGGVTTAPAGQQISTTSGGYLSSTGTWTNGSSRSYKRDIASWRGALDLLDDVRVVSYRYRPEYGDDGKRHIGVIAEELPDAVSTPDRKGAPTSDLIALSIGANQELLLKVKALEQQNQAQAERLRALEARLDRLQKQSENTPR